MTEFPERFQSLVDTFELAKSGTSPFDPDKLDQQFPTASHGEQAAIAFLLNVWNPSHEWASGRFDFMDAIGIWDDVRRKAFVSWANDPWWP